MPRRQLNGPGGHDTAGMEGSAPVCFSGTLASTSYNLSCSAVLASASWFIRRERNSVSIRPFDAGAVNAWLRPGERPIWISPGVRVHYEVDGRKPNGKLESTSVLWRIVRIVLFPITAVMILLELDDLTDARNDVIAKGSHARCQAAQLADVRADRSWWVLTEYRFAFVAVDPNGRPHTVWELTTDQYAHREQPRKWYRYSHDTIVFGDASSLAFVRDRRFWPTPLA